MSDGSKPPVAVSGAPFPRLGGSAEQAMAKYADLLREVMPMKAAHRRRLGDNIQELSAFLIEDRAEVLGRDYLHAPAALSAYLWYFLPWNLLRLSRLLGGLDLDPPDGANIIDLGAGPLTLVQALALARPDLLSRELHFHCLDSTPKPMREGRKLYHGLVEALGGRDTVKWRVHLVHAPWQVGIKGLPRADLLTAANFLNELPWNRRDPLSEQVESFYATVTGHVRSEGQCLFVEPGNRFGGKLISLVRESAVAAGWNVLGPCTHHQPCPMLEHKETAWCHFTLDTQGCPAWLRELSREAGLAKRDISLSYVHLAGPAGRRIGSLPGVRPGDEPGALAGAGKDLARIISSEFPVPDRERGRVTGRYGCSARGKLLLLSEPAAPGTRSGDIVLAQVPEKPRRDPKTQALIVSLESNGEPGRSQKRPPAGPSAQKLVTVRAKSKPVGSRTQDPRRPDAGEGSRATPGKGPHRPGKPAASRPARKREKS